MYKLLGYVNEVDSHNKSRLSDFALEKFWITQCSWLWLFTAVDTVMTITNLWKLFCYRVKIYHYEKLIGIREFLERLDIDCFNNIFQLILGPRQITHLQLIMSTKYRRFLLAVHFIITVLFILPHRS